MADPKIIRFLETVPLCQGFTRSQLEVLANLLHLQLFPPNAVIFREGDPGDSFYFIMDGEVGVYKQVPGAGPEKIATLSTRDPVGHLCLIDGQSRSATCTAHNRSLMLKCDKRLFDRLFKEGDSLAFRFIDAISRDLCKKLRTTNQRLYDLYAKPEETVSRLKEVAINIAKTMEEDVETIEVVKSLSPREKHQTQDKTNWHTTRRS